MAHHPLDSPITSVILGGCDPPEVGFASLCSIACPRPVIRHAPHSSPNATSAQTTLPLNLPSLRHIAATETTRALFPSLLDVSALDERFSAQGHLTFGVDAIGARFVDNARESLYALPDAPLPVKEAMGAGWTIQLHQPQRFEDDLWRMMAAMEAEMGTLVGANAYLTPACAQGLAPHWDDVQVAVLQLYGEKTWSVWENRQRMNYSSGDLDRQRLGEPTATVVMRPGDVLLLPRGYVHQAVSLAGGESGHLTLSWGQGDSDTLGLVAKTVEAAMALPPFHLELPDVLKVNVRMDGKDEDGAGGDGGEGGGEEGTGLAALLRALADHVETRPAVGRNGRNALAHDFMSSRLPPHPSQLPTEDELVPEEELTFQDDDVLELVGDFFCVLKDTPPTDIRLEVDAGRGVTVGFEGGEELRIMSSVDNHRESHMMSGAGGAGGGCGDERCADEACQGGHAHDHAHDHAHSSMDDDEEVEEEEDSEEDSDSESSYGGSLVSVPIAFRSMIESVLRKRRVTVGELEFDDTETRQGAARMLVDIGMCVLRPADGGNKNKKKKKG